MNRPLSLTVTFALSLGLGWAAVYIFAPAKHPVVRSSFDGPGTPRALRKKSAEWDRFSAELEGLPNLAERRRSLIHRIARSQPQDIAPLLILLQEQDVDLLDLLARQWVERDPKAFASALESFPKMTNDLAGWTHTFYRRWAEKDPDAAFARAHTTNVDHRHHSLHAVVTTRFDTSPDQALEWCAKIPAGYTTFCADGWAGQHPDQVLAKLDVIRSLPRNMVREKLLAAAAAQLAKTDVRAALNLTGDISANYQSNARRSIARGWVKAQPEEARAFVETATDIPLRTAVASNLGETWADTKPAEAIPWALRWLTGKKREFVLQRAFAKLEKSDPAQATALRETLPRPVPPPL